MVEGPRVVFRGLRAGSDTAAATMRPSSLSIHLPHPNGIAGAGGITTHSYRASRLACLLAAAIAFLIGVAVGITLPMVLVITPTHNTPVSLPLIAHQEVSSLQSLDVQQMDAPQTTKDVSGSTRYINDLDSGDGKKIYKVPVNTWAFPQIVRPVEENNSLQELDILEDEVINSLNDVGKEDDVMLLVDGIYWGDAVEASLPKGFSDEQVVNWRKFIRHQPVVRLEEGCGRMQNRMLTFENGTKSCCRYRQNHDQIQGEIFSFYLSRLLDMKNVPPSALGLVQAGAWQWSGVSNQLTLAQWGEDRPVVMTQFVEDLGSAFIPQPLRAKTRRLHPLDVEEFSPHDSVTLSELAQWSDLLIFDYLTANLDRVVNNLYNMQWNPSMMEAPAHNLARQEGTGLLVFLDNESGLLHGYRLLDKYEKFHASLMQSLCVFRRSTAEAVKRLVARGDVGVQLRKTYRRHEPDLQDFLPPIPDKSIKILNERLNSVHKQITKCEKLYRDS
ncbi:unnamed protein product [Meganyctiphanes norvegica]|uniref:Uncharacterized protein n=1 Tax=Meganyctiphanes norvegica TaxID=48144 RepID=A0AAV2QU89_MEGNR